VWIEKMLDFIAQYPILGFIGETGQIRRAIEPMLRRRMDERKIYTRLIWLPHNAGDKTSDSRSLQAMCGLGRVRLPENESWSARLIDELLKFPDGKTDDFSDTAFLMARWMDKTGVAHVPRASPSHKILPGSSRELRIADFLPKSGSLSNRQKKRLYL